jgi:leader peptidase (prepilin peptidase)/N-methyltransferase
MAMVGAFMGWKMAILVFFIAPFFGAVYGIIEKIRTKDTAIAYGPFLALSALICLFWGDVILGWIMHGYGLY